MRQLLLGLLPAPPPSLDNFVPGRNGAVLEALRSVLAGQERFVYLWGPPSSGKSHLLKAFARQAASTHPSAYIGSDDAWEQAEHAQKLAVDDTPKLNDLRQGHLFDLYNRLLPAGGALLASGDAPPMQLSMRNDLRTRLGSGVVLQLHPLNDAEKMAALRKHAASRALVLSDDMVNYFLTHFRRDMGTQIAVLDALDRYSLENKRPVSLALLKQALQELDTAL
jgi:DnaA family protein